MKISYLFNIKFATLRDVTMQAREYQERLAQKTAFLKSLAVDIEGEAKDSHRLLGGVGDDMEGSR